MAAEWRIKMNGSVRDYQVLGLIFYLSTLPSIGASLNLNNTCPKEIANIPNSTEYAVWSSSGKDNEIIISNPPCLDRHDGLIVRICHNKTWIPDVTPSCFKVWNDGCISPYEHPHSCDFLTEATVWETSCNVAKKSHYSSSSSLSSSGSKIVWMPFKRRTKFGPYELSDRGKHYGFVFKNYDIFYSTKDVFNKDCLVIDTESNKIRAANCKEKHSRICSRNTDDICPKHCLYSPSTSKCYCKIKSSECRFPIEIKSPEDFVLVQELADEEECYVNSENIPKFHKVKQYIGNGHWSYTDRSLNCSICSYNVDNNWKQSVEMFLNFYEETRELTLIIYAPLHLAYKGEEDYVYCFVGNPHKLRRRVKIEKVYNPPQLPEGEISFYVYKIYLDKHMNNYWCEVHLNHLTEEMLVSNQILAYQEKNGYEYSLRLNINNACEIFNCTEAINSNFDDFIPEQLVRVLDGLEITIRVLDVIYFDFEKLDYVLHLTTETEQDLITEYAELTYKLMKLENNIKMIELKSSEYCMPQLIPTGTSYLNFPLAAIGQVVVPNELCLKKNNLPVVRMCKGNFLYGSQWSTVIGDCELTETSETTRYMHSVVNQNLSKSCVANVSRLVRKEDLSLVDVYYVSKILKKANNVKEEDDIFDDSLDIVDGLMTVELDTLKQAQDLLNTTDDILDSLERFSSKLLQKTSILIQKDNYIIHVTKPFQTNTSGVLLYYKNKTITTVDFKINDTYESVQDKDYLKLAVQVPFYQLNEWLLNNATTDLRIITTIFLDDRLFGSDPAETEGPVVGVTVPGFGHFLKYPIQIWFKNSRNSKSGTCAFWNYGRPTQRYKGTWSGIGGDYVGRLTDASIDVCLFSHLTHFALLVIDSNIEEQDEYILTVLTYIGDFLTFFGLTGIFATALLFESWRRRQGTKILLNLSAAIIIEDVVTSLLQSKIIGSDKSCQYIGPTLQYIIVSKYCWMLVYAFLQYVRFVKVLGPIPTNIVFKSVLFGWGAPCIPVVIVCFFNPYSYGLKNYLYCYPKDVYLYIGLLIPISLIIVTNTVVFFIVMRNVTAKTSDVYSRNLEATSQKLQFQLATLLFFVLGLPMMLGLLSNLIKVIWLQTAMVYLYCITSNLQGFMLFLFYVILNKETRNKWIHYYTGKRKLSLSISSKTKT